MLRWNIHYEISALLVLSIFLAYYKWKNRLNTLKNRCFAWAGGTLVLCEILDILTAITLSYAERVPVWVNATLNSLFYVLQVVLFLTLLNYILVFTKQYALRVSNAFIWFSLPAIIMLILLIFNVGYGWVFTIHNGYYEYGPLWKLWLLFYVFYLALFGILIINSRKYVKKDYFLAGICVMVVVAIMFTIQLVSQISVLLTCFGVSIALITLYMVAQNPDKELDQNTDFLNLFAFEEVIEEKLAMKENIVIACIIYKDMDSLKQIHGTKKSKEILICMLKVLNILLNDDEKMYVQNDEKIWISTSDSKRMESIISSYRQKLMEGVTVDGIYASTDLWCCVLTSPKDATDYDEIIGLTDFSIKHMKKYSANGMLVMNEQIKQDYYRNRKVKKALKRTLEDQELKVFFQPLFDQKTGKVRAAEALTRIYDEDLGWISPNEYIPVAEQEGSIIELGRQIFEMVCQFMAKPEVIALNLLYISVNVSAAQLSYDRIADEFEDLVRKYQVPMSKINIEITESIQIKEMEAATRFMSRLGEQGATFSLDDYGTGYSNISYIMNMQFNTVKLDKIIVRAYFDQNNEMLPGLIALFHNLKLKVTAEGVETNEEADELTAMGCDYLQGYFLSKPIAGWEFIELTEKYNDYVKH